MLRNNADERTEGQNSLEDVSFYLLIFCCYIQLCIEIILVRHDYYKYFMVSLIYIIVIKGTNLMILNLNMFFCNKN